MVFYNSHKDPNQEKCLQPVAKNILVNGLWGTLCQYLILLSLPEHSFPGYGIVDSGCWYLLTESFFLGSILLSKCKALLFQLCAVHILYLIMGRLTMVVSVQELLPRTSKRSGIKTIIVCLILLHPTAVYLFSLTKGFAPHLLTSTGSIRWGRNEGNFQKVFNRISQGTKSLTLTDPGDTPIQNHWLSRSIHMFWSAFRVDIHPIPYSVSSKLLS